MRPCGAETALNFRPAPRTTRIPSCVGIPEKRMVPFYAVFADSDAVPPGTS